jgi:hypothetical protein
LSERTQPDELNAQSEATAGEPAPGDALIVSTAELRRIVQEAISGGAPATVVPSDAAEIHKSPLSPADFEYVARRLVELGLSWTPDAAPSLIKTGLGELNHEEIRRLMTSYPGFQREFRALVHLALTGHTQHAELVGDREVAPAKTQTVLSLLSEEFRSEFFFRNATKVPRFVDLDWEVVVKSAERGVARVPGTHYALLRLQAQGERGTSALIFAVNEVAARALLEEVRSVLAAIEGAREHGPAIRDDNSPDTCK